MRIVMRPLEDHGRCLEPREDAVLNQVLSFSSTPPGMSVAELDPIECIDGIVGQSPSLNEVQARTACGAH
jgi:hypothetical protein